ncbi:MAG: hypothetical protein F2813_03845 [Actinobacteria bacterium]|uniref:Unannotated protein n=1 Tax=freshwater metagenome TaxID=449393 RepID=A0A6J5ZQE7_9ZZZZ|nr:hypothetical protein [Actinomycetota bacterium]
MSNAPGPNDSALAQAIQRVSSDTRGLIQDQVDLAKLELQQKATVFGRGTVIAIAAGVFLIGALLLIIEGASWLAWYLFFPNDTFFWGFFLMAFLLIVCAVLAGLLAAKMLKKAKVPVPDQALAAARQTQAVISEEARLTSEQVRDAVVLPEEDR